MLPYAATVLAARQAAAGHGALATFGKVIAEPGAANAISSAVRAWLDARAPDEATLHRMVRPDRGRRARAPRPIRASRSRCAGSRSRRGSSSTRSCGTGWPGRWPAAGSPRRCCRPAPGTTPGVLAARLPAAMLFVRNPTGVSHSPAEHADPADCEAGVAALAAVLEDLAGR